jgi:hypothetical protein
MSTASPPSVLWEIQLASGHAAKAYLLPMANCYALVWHIDSRLHDAKEFISKEEALKGAVRLRDQLHNSTSNRSSRRVT